MAAFYKPKRLVFRPSGAHRWLNCPGSAWVSTSVATRSSPYATEGTIAHAYLAHCLTGRPLLDFLTERDLPKDEKGKPITDVHEILKDIPQEDLQKIAEMARLVQDMAALEGCEIRIEVKMGRVFAGHQVIEGTADIILFNPSRLFILDYKHGAGRKVKVDANPQTTLYFLMALLLYPSATDWEMAIIQPRGRGDGFTSWIPSRDYLDAFVANVDAAVRRAYVEHPEFIEGPWCWGCAGEELGACPAKLMSALRFYTGLSKKEADEIKKEENKVVPAWWLLDHVANTERVAKKIKEEARARLLEGGRVPGWTLKDGLGNRRWKTPAEMPDVLARLTGADPNEFIQKPKKPKPISLTDAKHHPLLKGHDLKTYIERPRTRTLCHSDDIPESYLEAIE